MLQEIFHACSTCCPAASPTPARAARPEFNLGTRKTRTSAPAPIVARRDRPCLSPRPVIAKRSPLRLSRRQDVTATSACVKQKPDRTARCLYALPAITVGRCLLADAFFAAPIIAMLAVGMVVGVQALAALALIVKGPIVLATPRLGHDLPPLHQTLTHRSNGVETAGCGGGR
ncbi:MAG: hypothetical protein IPK66_11460 [Rhodospirillales bacterium]|nr:hypothetical protein [Rhodospirillales bacterium]